MNESKDADRVDWSEYARVYDFILAYNPAYQEIVRQFEDRVRGWRLPTGGRVLDFCAGTGNFGLSVARLHPEVDVVLFDRDPEMLRLAKAKASEAGLRNVEFVQGDALEAKAVLGAKPFDGVVAVHCLYTLPQPGTLRSLAELVREGAPAYLCDLGREMRPLSWAAYLFRSIWRTHGFFRMVKIFWQGRRIAPENARIRQLQLSGRYWMHSTSEFGEAVRNAGFEVETLGTVFRGLSDFATAVRSARNVGA